MWRGSDQPRAIRGRHVNECGSASCAGCWPCEERHCRCCGIEHVTVDGRGTDETCATCIGATRDDLTEIVRLSGRLMPEAIVKGVNSEAANLAGPAADPEAYQHRVMSGIAGRTPEVFDAADTAMHPLFVLATWEDAAREHHQHPTRDLANVSSARAYLAQHLSRLAQDGDFAFEELAGDLRRCRAHLEDVLSEGERDERGAPCISCGRARLVKSYGEDHGDDRWTCPRCKQWWSEADYRAKVDGIYVQHADRLTASQIEATYRVPEGTVRRWANAWNDRGTTRLPKVRKRGKDGQGRQLYDVGDVLATRDGDTPIASGE